MQEEVEEEYERTLLQLPCVHVFRIPPRTSAEGYRAADWPKDPSWTGKLKIIAKGKVLSILLLDNQTLQLFARCNVTDDNTITRTLDSGRYFVLKITNNDNRHAFIGIAFNERNDAFDFNVTISEFNNELKREEMAMNNINNNHISKDLSLKEGEKIKIKIKKKTSDNCTDPTNQSFTGKLPPPGSTPNKKGGLLAPPPKDNHSFNNATTNPSTTTTTATTTSSSTGGFSSDPFADDPFGSVPGTAANQPTVFEFSDPFSAPVFDTNNTNAPPAKPAKPNKEANLLDF